MSTAPPVLPPPRSNGSVRVQPRAAGSANGRIPRKDSDSNALWAVLSLLLGLLVAVLGFFALLMWGDARHAKEAANRAAAKVTAAGSHSMAGTGTTGGLTSYAGAAPANADAVAAAHKPFPATLPAAAAGPVANV